MRLSARGRARRPGRHFWSVKRATARPGSALREAGLTYSPLMELASNGAIKRAVARELGVSILSRYATLLELELGNLVELPVDGFPLRREWHLFYPRDRRQGPVEEAFLGFVEAGRWRERLGRPVTTD